LTTSVANSGEKSTEINDRALGIWLELIDLFGNGFVTANGKRPAGRWLRCINEMTDEQVRRGLRTLEYEDDSDIPPSVKKFRRVCTALHQMDVPKLEAPAYTLQDAQMDAFNAGVPRDLIPGKTMDELHQLELKARHGGFRGLEQ